MYIITSIYLLSLMFYVKESVLKKNKKKEFSLTNWKKNKKKFDLRNWKRINKKNFQFKKPKKINKKN
jgi:hypothetical protein